MVHYYYWARKEGLLPTNHSVHAGIRSTLELRVYRSSPFLPIEVDGVLRRTRETVPDAEPVHVSLDVDSLDPTYAPRVGATGDDTDYR